MSSEQVTNIILGTMVAVPSVMAFLAAHKAGTAVVEVVKKVDANTAITVKVAEDVVETKHLADGNLTKALAEIDRLRQIVEQMRDNAPLQPPTGPGRQSLPPH